MPCESASAPADAGAPAWTPLLKLWANESGLRGCEVGARPLVDGRPALPMPPPAEFVPVTEDPIPPPAVELNVPGTPGTPAVADGAVGCGLLDMVGKGLS